MPLMEPFGVLPGEVVEAKPLKDMVGPWGLEPQTSTVSKRRDQALPTTWKALGTALVRGNTAKPDSLQVNRSTPK